MSASVEVIYPACQACGRRESSEHGRAFTELATALITGAGLELDQLNGRPAAEILPFVSKAIASLFASHANYEQPARADAALRSCVLDNLRALRESLEENPRAFLRVT